MEDSIFTQIKNEVTAYGKAVGNVGLLLLVRIVSRVLGLFLLIFTIVLCALAILAFAAVSLIDVLNTYMPLWGSALVVSCLYVLLVVIAVVCRKSLFINPFIKLLSDQIATEEELDVKILETEHEAEMRGVRMECHVENATRELNFYINLLSRIWGAITKLLKR